MISRKYSLHCHFRSTGVVLLGAGEANSRTNICGKFGNCVAVRWIFILLVLSQQNSLVPFERSWRVSCSFTYRRSKSIGNS